MTITNYISFDIGIRNLAYCVIQYNSENNSCSIQNWDIINLCKDDEKVKKVSLYQICSRLIDKLHELGVTSNFVVLIENQPVLTNPKMKSIQIMVYTYFVMLGCSKVVLFSPRQKFFVYDGPTIECTLKSKYAQRKKLGIAYCSYFVGEFESYRNFFETHKKKDDLSDCFLQAMSYIKKNIDSSIYLI